MIYKIVSGALCFIISVGFVFAQTIPNNEKQRQEYIELIKEAARLRQQIAKQMSVPGVRITEEDVVRAEAINNLIAMVADELSISFSEASALFGAAVADAIGECHGAGTDIVACARGQVLDQIIKIRIFKSIYKQIDLLKVNIDGIKKQHDDAVQKQEAELARHNALLLFFALLFNIRGAADQLALSDAIIAQIGNIYDDLIDQRNAVIYLHNDFVRGRLTKAGTEYYLKYLVSNMKNMKVMLKTLESLIKSSKDFSPAQKIGMILVLKLKDKEIDQHIKNTEKMLSSSQIESMLEMQRVGLGPIVIPPLRRVP